ncbi:hypothetical protein [uncultured Prevotella sp.]|nr:hypothetical protein [uncultured Prevotella sp.]
MTSLLITAYEKARAKNYEKVRTDYEMATNSLDDTRLVVSCCRRER